jgi:hypothetical protein
MFPTIKALIIAFFLVVVVADEPRPNNLTRTARDGSVIHLVPDQVGDGASRLNDVPRRAPQIPVPETVRERSRCHDRWRVGR